MRHIGVIVMAVFFLLIVSGSMACGIANVMEIIRIQNYNNHAWYENKERGDFLLTDQYDTEKDDMFTFFDQGKSMEILHKTYKALCEWKGRYREVSFQPVEYIGHLDIDKAFTDGNDPEQINQTIDGREHFTPLKAIQINANMLVQDDMKTPLKSLHQRGDNVDTVGVLLGSKYKGVMKKGDRFTVRYVGSKEIQCIVADFLKRNISITVDDKVIPLDYYIVSNMIDFKEEDDDVYKKILLSIKCEGYLHYNNIKQRNECIALIQKIRKETGFQYTIPRVKKNMNTLFQMGALSSGLLTIVTMALFILLCDNIYKRCRKLFARRKATIVVLLGIVLSSASVAFKTVMCVFDGHKEIFSSSHVAYISIVCAILFFLFWSQRMDTIVVKKASRR